MNLLVNISRNRTCRNVLERKLFHNHVHIFFTFSAFNGVFTLERIETRTWAGNKWVVCNCVQAFTIHLNQDKGHNLLYPIVQALVPVTVSVPAPLSVNTP